MLVHECAVGEENLQEVVSKGEEAVAQITSEHQTPSEESAGNTRIFNKKMGKLNMYHVYNLQPN